MNRYFISAIVAAFSSASAAFAGGYVAPVIETAPIVVAPIQSLTSWTGPYIGANLGWGKGKVFFIHGKNGDEPSTRPAQTVSKPDGFSGALRIGHDWQYGRGVFGLGAEYGFGKYKDEFAFSPRDLEFAPDHFEIKNPATLFARAGYAFNDKILGYALLGYTWADGIEPFTHNPDGMGDVVDFAKRSLDGMTVGAGAEYRFHSNWSAYAEYTYTDFGHLIDTNGNYEYDIDLQLVKLGVNYRF